MNVEFQWLEMQISNFSAGLAGIEKTERVSKASEAIVNMLYTADFICIWQLILNQVYISACHILIITILWAEAWSSNLRPTPVLRKHVGVLVMVSNCLVSYLRKAQSIFSWEHTYTQSTCSLILVAEPCCRCFQHSPERCLYLVCLPVKGKFISWKKRHNSSTDVNIN